MNQAIVQFKSWRPVGGTCAGRISQKRAQLSHCEIETRQVFGGHEENLWTRGPERRGKYREKERERRAWGYFECLPEDLSATKKGKLTDFDEMP